MPKSLLSSALILAGIAALLLMAGCRNPFIGPPPPPPVTEQPVQQPAQQTPEDAGKATIQTVMDYLNDLNEGNYSAAYSLLSSESQQLHTSAKFEQAGKKGMPLYDFKTAKASVDGDTASVEIRQLEDPATHGFSLVREDGAWKVVYRGGIPGQPTPEP